MRHQTPHRRVVQALVGSAGFLFLVLASFTFSAFDENGNFKSSFSSLERRAGNTDIASDLYGLGVRIGVYTQSAGMLLSAVFGQVGGIKIACSGTMLGLSLSWTILARNRDFSACEAFLVISLIGVISLAGMPVSITAAPEEGIGALALIIANLWAMAITLWFWGALYAVLPILGTTGDVWLFTRVSVRGWFRIFMIVLASINCFVVVAGAVAVMIFTYKLLSKNARRNAQTLTPTAAEIAEAVKDLEQAKKDAKKTVWIVSGFGAVVLILTIASVEMIIKYNNLSPENTVSSPGQTIALTIGLLVFADGIFVAIGRGVALRARSKARRR